MKWDQRKIAEDSINENMDKLKSTWNIEQEDWNSWKF